MSNTEIMNELTRLKAENEKLRQPRTMGITFRVSEKGAVSVYGLGRFPVTLYQEQWEKLLNCTDALRSFIKTNSNSLSKKDEDNGTDTQDTMGNPPLAGKEPNPTLNPVGDMTKSVLDQIVTESMTEAVPF